jgi:2-C-methyl-D-erythritol 4-phosphate cytidylyltransferase/2-C-methyl-D-erythritol 2,4-cyclodiphosphate synthase
MKTSIILVAAGKGERFGQPKWGVQLAGKTLLEWSLDIVSKLDFEMEVIVVVSPGGERDFSIPPLPMTSRLQSKWKKGGNTRYESVQAGLQEATGDLIIIHNIANPLASTEDFIRIRDVLLEQDAACFVGQKNVDTLRRVVDEKSSTIDRSDIWRVQTPQGFRSASLRKLIESNKETDLTDEVQLFEKSGTPVVAIETSPQNQKITYPQDLELMERYLGHEVLVGIGEDSHYFDTTGTIVLGGVKIEGVPKLQGNSDGDVILHALFNAISSALGKRSLGITADPMAEQGIIDSSEYLQVILEEVRTQGYSINNVSISLECSQPKIEPLSDSIKNSLSQLLTINHQQIGITATSGEGLTSFGKGEGIRCLCIVTLSKSSYISRGMGSN